MVMNANLVLPFLSSTVMLVFTAGVPALWRSASCPFSGRRAGAGSFAEAYFAGVGWSRRSSSSGISSSGAQPGSAMVR
jgi:hypothetical protein